MDFLWEQFTLNHISLGESHNHWMYIQDIQKLFYVQNWDSFINFITFCVQTFTYPKLTIETLEQGVKYVQS